MLKLGGYILSVCLLSFVAQAEELSLEDTIDVVNPSVVSIVVDTDSSQALGAGVIVSSDGYVVTNAHVTQDAKQIKAVLDDIEYEAKLIGTDSKTDIALLKINSATGFSVSGFADSDLVRVGNPVFAIGNPFGLGNSVSLGIISAKERDIEKGPYDSFLQTDASINQGNSGGPLFDMSGEIVGINTAIFSTDGKNIGVGFATPSNIVQWVIKQIKQHGKVVRGWLGIGVKKVTITDSAAKQYLVIASMAENSPATKAGLKVGDVLQKVGTLSLKNPRQFSLGVAETAPKTTLPITVLRDNQPLNFSVTVAQMPQSEVKPLVINDSEATEWQELGLDTVGLAKATYFQQIGIKAYFDEKNKSFVIVDVDKFSEAQNKGIKKGDTFNLVNNRKIFGVEDLRIKLKEASGAVVLQFINDDSIDTVTLSLKEEK